MKNTAVLSLSLFVFLCFGNPGLVAGEEEKSAPSPGVDYLLGPEDIVEISVWRDETLTRQVMVRPDGRISFPLIGDIVAQGRSVDELRKAIEEKIKEYVPDAPVTVMLLQLGSPKVFVVGQVAKPGVYVMGQPLTVLQVLAMAGGFREWAKKDDIIIVRKADREQKTIEFNYKKVAGGRALEQNVLLKPGDTIVVP
jgi:polysaccharide export outer membrane protein